MLPMDPFEEYKERKKPTTKTVLKLKLITFLPAESPYATNLLNKVSHFFLVLVQTLSAAIKITARRMLFAVVELELQVAELG